MVKLSSKGKMFSHIKQAQDRERGIGECSMNVEIAEDETIFMNTVMVQISVIQFLCRTAVHVSVVCLSNDTFRFQKLK